MKLPDSLSKESTHVTGAINTLTLTGISLMWMTALGLINPWWNIATVLCLLAGYGNEVRKRDKDVRF